MALGLTATPAGRGNAALFNGKTETTVFIAEAGVVPIYFTSGPANVVPVQIMGAPDVGVVTCRVATPGPNVVPVRDVGTGETPRVQIVLV